MEPRIITRTEAHSLGYSDDELQRACRDGQLCRLGRGLYAQGELATRDRHLARAVLALARLPRATALSHVTAALMHRLPVEVPALETVHVTRSRATGRHTADTLIHSAALAEENICLIDGLRVTSLARTVVDSARLLGFDDGVVLADAALRGQVLTRRMLDAALEESRQRMGIPKARRVVAAACDRSESPGETRSRLLLARRGIPAPVLQANVRSSDGRWLARPDFLWDDYGVIGEFDGKVKYTADAAKVVIAEKAREDRLREAGWFVVRWVWADLLKPKVLQRRIERAFARGSCSPSPFSIDPLPKPPPLSGPVLAFKVGLDLRERAVS